MTTDLFINALLPPTRKLISLPLRGADWKALRKNDKIDEATRDRTYAYWHFEAALKELYFGESFALSRRPTQFVDLYHPILLFRIPSKRSSGHSGQSRCEQKSGNYLRCQITLVLTGEGAVIANNASE